MKIDINKSVKVKLTKTGLDILKKKHDKLFSDMPSVPKKEFLPPKTDEIGYSEFQLWELMNIFGDYMRISNTELPFFYMEIN